PRREAVHPRRADAGRRPGGRGDGAGQELLAQLGMPRLIVVLALLAGCGGDPQPAYDVVDPVGSSVIVDRGAARADGKDLVHITVLARDSEGGALAGRPVSLVVSGGASAEPATGRTGPAGALTARLFSREPGAVTVNVAIDGVLLADRPRVTFV